VLHRRVREDWCSNANANDLASRFAAHIGDGLWNLIPVTEGVLRRTSALILSAPQDLFIRTADAVHLTSAQEAGLETTFSWGPNLIIFPPGELVRTLEILKRLFELRRLAIQSEGCLLIVRWLNQDNAAGWQLPPLCIPANTMADQAAPSKKQEVSIWP